MNVREILPPELPNDPVTVGACLTPPIKTYASNDIVLLLSIVIVTCLPVQSQLLMMQAICCCTCQVSSYLVLVYEVPASIKHWLPLDTTEADLIRAFDEGKPLVQSANELAGTKAVTAIMRDNDTKR